MAAPTEVTVPVTPSPLSALSLTPVCLSVCLPSTCGRALHLYFQLSACCADIDKLATQRILPPANLSTRLQYPDLLYLLPHACPSVFYDSNGNIFAFKKQLIFISAAHTLATLSMAQKPIKSVLPAQQSTKKRNLEKPPRHLTPSACPFSPNTVCLSLSLLE